MVRQGDIIKVNFDPKSGHEQAGYRPALVVSNDFFNRRTNLAIVCPISNTANLFPLHIALDEGLQTTGSVLCQHIRTLDVNARGYKYVESVSSAYLAKILAVISAEIS